MVFDNPKMEKNSKNLKDVGAVGHEVPAGLQLFSSSYDFFLLWIIKNHVYSVEQTDLVLPCSKTYRLDEKFVVCLCTSSIVLVLNKTGQTYSCCVPMPGFSSVENRTTVLACLGSMLPRYSPYKLAKICEI